MKSTRLAGKDSGHDSSTNVLNSYRDKIDLLDAELLGLLNARARIVSEIASIKKLQGLPVYDGRREQEILERITQNNPGPLDHNSVIGIFRCIIRESRRLENDFIKLMKATVRREEGIGHGHQYGTKRIRG